MATKPRYCAFVVYPSSDQFEGMSTDDVQKYVQDKMEYNGLKGFISPLHEPDEEDKKPHYHVIIIRGSRQGFEIDTWRGYVHQCGGANDYPFIPNAPCAYIRYLLHLDNPNKQQFNDSCLCVGGLDYGYYSNLDNFKEETKKEDIYAILNNITSFISDYDIISYASLVNIAKQEHKEWLPIIYKKHSIIIAYMRSLEYDYRIKQTWLDEQETHNQTNKIIALGFQKDYTNSVTF